MRCGRRLRKEPRVENLREQRPAFEWITQNHVHHFVVAWIAERLVKSPLGERSAENHSMTLPAREHAVRRFVLWLDFRSHRLKPVKKPVQPGDNGLRQFRQDAS